MKNPALRHSLILLALGLVLVHCGCQASTAMNPAFPLSIDEARAELEQMAAHPVAPPRPIVVAAGLFDPGPIASDVRRRLQRVTSSETRIISVSFFWSLNFDACRAKLLDAVDREFPSDDPNEPIELDVIGFSMGGLVARYAAMPHEDGRQLNIHRLFTLGTPHRGAKMAPLAPFDQRARAMRAGSPFLARLDEDLARGRYELLPYVRTDDAIVGESNAAPPGCEPWWVPNRPWSLSHNLAGRDPRLIADIARRLRGEEPYTRAPAAAMPQATSRKSATDV